MGKQGTQSVRGRGELYAEVKDQQINLLLTATGKKLLDTRIREYCDARGVKLSRCEYFERWARGLL